MSYKTTISVGQSVQVFNIGQPEQWNKFAVTRDYDAEVDELKVIDELVELIKKAHEKHSASIQDIQPRGDLYFNVSRQREERG